MLPLAIRASALPRVQRLLEGGERSLRALLADVPLARVPIDDAVRDELLNVNTPDDVARLAESGPRT